MIDLKWLCIGLLCGLLIGAVLVPPTRKKPVIPSPSDMGRVFAAETGGCIKLNMTEVPCVAEPDSLNVLASFSAKK